VTPRRKSTEIDWLDAAMDGDDFATRAMGMPPHHRTPTTGGSVVSASEEISHVNRRLEPTWGSLPASPQPKFWHDIVTIAAGALVIGLVVLAVFNIPIWSN